MAGATARTAAELVGVNKTTSDYYFHRLRVLIADYVDEHSMFEGEVEIDESYFGGKRKEKRRRGLAGKILVFGLLKRGGKVYAKVDLTTEPDTENNQNLENQNIIVEVSGITSATYLPHIKDTLTKWKNSQEAIVNINGVGIVISKENADKLIEIKN